tara:strand:+ start:41 stop:217 length:177 start_codon:yes stop_codon:yes gene_type:complete
MKTKKTKNIDSLKKNGWNEVYLNRILKKEVHIGANGTQKYVFKQGKNKGKVCSELSKN